MSVEQRFRDGVCELCRAPMDDHERVLSGELKCRPRPESKGKGGRRG